MAKIRFSFSCLLLLGLAVSGCGGTAQYLRSQPTTYYQPPQTEIKLKDADLKSLFSVKCMMGHPSDLLVASNKQVPQCLYIAIDAADLAAELVTTAALRDKAAAYLISVSDANFSNFMDRSFANKAGLDLSKSLVGDIATGASAVTAFNTPAVSAGLSLANLVVGKTVDNVNTAYYFDKTFQAFEAAVITERSRIKSEIISRQAQRPVVAMPNNPALQYGLFELMADIRTYDDACSMRAGLAKLVETSSELKMRQVEQSARADTGGRADSLTNAKAAVPTMFLAPSLQVGPKPATASEASPAGIPVR